MDKKSGAALRPPWQDGAALQEPELASAALYGVAGDIVRKLEPYSEAHPAALYMQLLTCFGSALGNGTYFEVESDRHPANLFLAVVGKSAKTRKGVSWGRIEKIMAQVDGEWTATRQAGGLCTLERLPKNWAGHPPSRSNLRKRCQHFVTKGGLCYFDFLI
jgi:hypothetical protein